MITFFNFKRLFLCHVVFIFFMIFSSLSYYYVKPVYGAVNSASYKSLEDTTENYFHLFASQNYPEINNTSYPYFSPYLSFYGIRPFGTDLHTNFPDMMYGRSGISYGGLYDFEGENLFVDSTLGLYEGYNLYNGLGLYGLKDPHPYGEFGGFYRFENLYPYGGMAGLYGLGGLYNFGDSSDATTIDKPEQTQISPSSNSISSGEDTSIIDPNEPPMPISVPLLTPLMVEPAILPTQALTSIPLAITIGVPSAIWFLGGGGISNTYWILKILLGLVDISIINIDLPCMGIYVPSDPYNFATINSFFPGGIYTGPVTTIEGNVITIITPVISPLYAAPTGVVNLNSINNIPIIPNNNLIIPSPFVTIYGPNGELLSGREAAIIGRFPWL